jgi:cholesterol transport system auxiliary component
MTMRELDRGGPTRRLLLGGALALGPSLAGCAGLIPGTGEPPQIYVLTPKTTVSPDLPRATWQLLVDVPAAPAEIDKDRIALSRTPYTIDYFANAAWPDRAPVMVQQLLVESFEATGKITAIARESAALRADYILRPELRLFKAIYEQPDAPPSVAVRLNARLVKMPDRQIIAQIGTERRVKAARNSMDAIVEAFDEALGGAMKPIIEWTLRTPAVGDRTS